MGRYMYGVGGKNTSLFVADSILGALPTQPHGL